VGHATGDFIFAFCHPSNRVSLLGAGAGSMNTGRSKLQATLSSEAFFSSSLVSAFFALGVIGLLHHPMWRDETYPWLLARFSSSLHDLYLSRDTAHFMLWDLMLWILTRFTHNCQSMQWLHLALATGSVWLVLQFGLLTKIQKALYCFGYFTLFEYCLVCREYVCVGLLIFTLCALRDRRRDSFVLQAVILFLLSNINVFATIIAFAFAAASVAEYIVRGTTAKLWATKRWALVISGLILCAALLCDRLQLIKPPEALAAAGWRHPISIQDLAVAVSNIWRGYIPIPRPFPHLMKLVWGSNFLLDQKPVELTLGVMLSLGLLAISTWTLRRSPMATTWYLSGSGLMMLLQSTVAPGAVRHHGLYFVLYLACLWSASIRGVGCGQPTLHGHRASASTSTHVRRFFLPSLLAIQAVAGVYAWGLHLRIPFSGSKAAADFIRQNGYESLPIVGSPEPNVSPLTAYLDRPIYYLGSRRYGTFSRETNTTSVLSLPNVLRQVATFATAARGDALLVLKGHLTASEGGISGPLRAGCLHPDGSVSSPSEQSTEPCLQMTLLAGATTVIVDEEYSIYLIHRP
jgi:hypothetical protein